MGNEVDVPTAMTLETLASVSPVLARFTERDVVGGLWRRSGLSPRDRSLVTVAHLVARPQAMELAHHVTLALDNGLQPAEVSETIAHLAFYAGWANAMSAVAVVQPLFAARGIEAGALPAAQVDLLPFNQTAENARLAAVEQALGADFATLAGFTTDLLFRDLWLRPGLAPRDRSLVTVAALVSSGQVAQIGFHLNKAMDNGLTQDQAAEVITHLAFYAGWPNAMSAVPVAKGVFDKRRA